jgi:hypothetical protein
MDKKNPIAASSAEKYSTCRALPRFFYSSRTGNIQRQSLASSDEFNYIGIEKKPLYIAITA